MITANVENLTGDLVRFQTSCEAKIKELEDKLQQGTRTPNSSSNEDVLQKLKEIENEIERLRLGKDEQSNEDQCSTAVVGGLAQKGSTEAAMTWLTDALWNHWAPRPVDHYIKQEEFSGMLFLKFKNQADRDTAVNVMKHKLAKLPEGRGMWAKPDKPLEERIILSILYGAKWMLNQWGWARQAMWVDDGPGVLKLGDDIVLTAVVCGETLNIEYGKDWESYMASEQWTKMVNDAQGKMANRSSKGETKGKGKKGSGKMGASY